MATIGIMDSGAGGLSVFREIRKVLPCERFIYYSDNAHCPYGEKSREYIQDRCREVVSIMSAKGAEAVVIACNTATAAAINTLREEFDIPFIGMEPAIKPAVACTRSGVVGVLATYGTLNASKYQSTKDRYGNNVRIVENVGKGFVELVENCEIDGPHARETVESSLRPLLDAGADTIVLGCTHYPFLLPLMQEIAGPEIKFIDPAPAVAKQVLNVLKEKGISPTDKKPGAEFLSSAPSRALTMLLNYL